MQLKQYLAANNLKVADFASEVGQSESAVKKWLRRERIPRHDAMAKILEVTGGAVSAADFFAAEAA